MMPAPPVEPTVPPRTRNCERRSLLAAALVLSLMLNTPEFVTKPPGPMVAKAWELPVPIWMPVALTNALVTTRPPALVERNTLKLPRLATALLPTSIRSAPSVLVSLTRLLPRQLSVPPFTNKRLPTPATVSSLSSVTVPPLMVIMAPWLELAAPMFRPPVEMELVRRNTLPGLMVKILTGEAPFGSVITPAFVKIMVPLLVTTEPTLKVVAPAFATFKTPLVLTVRLPPELTVKGTTLVNPGLILKPFVLTDSDPPSDSVAKLVAIIGVL